MAEFLSKTGTDVQAGLYKTAQTIGSLIASEEHMVHMKPTCVLGYMKHGLATWLEDAGGKVGGFVKVMPWHPNLAQVEGGLEKMEERAIENMDNDNSPTGFELGSLYIHPEERRQHHGGNLISELTQQVHKKHPGKMIFSVVDKENGPSTNLFIKQGWIMLGEDQLPRFHEKMGIDVLQGWEAYVFLDPESLAVITN